MKTFLLLLTLLITILATPCIAQDIQPPTKRSIHKIKSPKTKSSGLMEDTANPGLNHPDTLTYDPQLLLEGYYRLPDLYSTNFVRTPGGHTYSGTKNGIKMWDGSSNILINTENSNIPENNISALALDLNGQLWIGTGNSGIVLGVGESIKPFKIKPIPTKDRNIFSIAADEMGFVWVTFQNGGIECFKNGISCAYFPKL